MRMTARDHLQGRASRLLKLDQQIAKTSGAERITRGVCNHGLPPRGANAAHCPGT